MLERVVTLTHTRKRLIQVREIWHMMQKFVTLGAIPEIRSEPTDPDKGLLEIEVVIPVDIYWELQSLIRQIRYARMSGFTTNKQWQKFNRLIKPCILYERDRVWFMKNYGT